MQQGRFGKICVAREVFVVIGAVTGSGVTVVTVVIGCKNGSA